MESKFNSAEDSLLLIHKMIRDKKKQMGKSASHYILWGSSVSVAAFTNYLLMQMNFENPWLPWPIIMPLTGFLAIVMGYRQNKNQQVKSWIDQASDALWLSFTISLCIVIIASSLSGDWKSGYTFLLCLYGLGLFTSGSLLSFKPFKLGGIINWVLALLSTKLDFPDMFLVIVAAMISGYLIPGIILWRRERTHEV